jgi:hypothetical protein
LSRRALCAPGTRKQGRLAKPNYPPDEKSGAEERLRAAAAEAPSTTESCIGSINETCQSTPEGMSTIGMEECEARELAVWDERLDKAYRDGGGNVAQVFGRVIAVMA